MIAQCENRKAVRATIIEPAWLKNGLSAQTEPPPRGRTFSSTAAPAFVARKGTPFHECVIREFIDRAVSNEMAVAALADHGSMETG
jgi:hypothetical protein